MSEFVFLYSLGKYLANEITKSYGTYFFNFLGNSITYYNRCTNYILINSVQSFLLFITLKNNSRLSDKFILWYKHK